MIGLYSFLNVYGMQFLCHFFQKWICQECGMYSANVFFYGKDIQS